MTEENSNKDAVNISKKIDLEEGQDYLLTAIIAELNFFAQGNENEAAEIGKAFTLTVEGTILSGLLISGAEYGKLFLKRMRTGYEDFKLEKVAIDKLMKPYEDIFSFYKERKTEDEEASTVYFHMKDVIMLLPNGKHIFFDIWRGKIKDINAFALGRMTASST